MTDINGLNTASGLNILQARSTIVMAARAFGLEAIDTPYLKVRDTEGFRREVAVSRGHGFSGRLILHPSQVEAANAAFTPSEDDGQ